MSSPLSWNCWPDGNFQCLFSLEELQATSRLATNWVLETIQNRGSAQALTWQKGKELRRKCLGAIQCRGKTCHMRLAPHTRGSTVIASSSATASFVTRHCFCVRAGSSRPLHLFRDGGFFIHRGSHTHPTFTHSSVHIPDGSLAFIDFTPKYVISSDVGAAASAPQDTVCDPRLSCQRAHQLGSRYSMSRPPLLITALAPLNGRVSQTMLYCAGV
ncbi:hypothetical protein B0H17DRAFT_302658 [Mycena rosella]|uniref:Uncharacterized protein n=1 Tax=Mycena rosella TaxID=1033263 RepID=A0AAD7CVJ6_MYCRO|nr:hypothetical protein B0H17DRAFT_302658 [Mycena rosella]